MADKGELPVQVRKNLLFHVRIFAASIPFIGNQNTAFLGRQDLAYDFGVLFHHSFACIHEHHRNVAAFNGGKGPGDTVAFNAPLDPSPAAYPRCIDEKKSTPLIHHKAINGIMGCTRNSICNEPVFPDQAVDEGRFSHIRPPHHCDPGNSISPFWLA